jgi:hypothetical protein
MKLSAFFFVMILMFLNSTVFAFSYQVLQAIEKPVAMVSEGKKIQLVNKSVIDQDMKIKTQANQFVSLRLDKSFELSIFNDSEVNIQSIYNKQGLLSISVQFVSGQIYIQKIKNGSARLKLSSDFFDWQYGLEESGVDKTSLSQNLNLWMQLDLKKPSIQFCNRASDAEITLFDHETKINLSAQESIIFNGQIKDGLVAYDILLGGRKIPKGHWAEKSKCSFDELIKIEKNILKKAEVEQNKVKLNLQKKVAEKKKNDSEFLCHNPYGQLNDCAWIRSGTKCQRSRCDAQGKWSDLQNISVDKALSCQADFVVLNCGY